MDRQLMTGNLAAAWGARLAAVDYVPAFPITPQTEIIETLAEWADTGAIAARMVTMDCEHSMLTAAAAAAATGVRVFSATSSQGLLHAMEMIYTVAGWRAPFVLVNVSRALASPITLEPDHNDVLAARDSGFLQFHCASCQEILDGVLIATRLAEHPEVRLPAIVNLDGFYLSFTREPVELPAAGVALEFVGDFDPGAVRFRASQPISQAVAVLSGSQYSYFRYEAHLAARRALDAFPVIAAEFAARFGRHYAVLECHRMDDAEEAIVMIGSFASKARAAVDAMRARGRRVGLLRPRLLRPFPDQALREALRGLRSVAVLDQNLSMGAGGVLHAEIASALHGRRDMPMLASFIGGLGGRDISDAEFEAMLDEASAAAAAGEPSPPRLLYTADELRELRKLQGIAAVERKQVGTRP